MSDIVVGRHGVHMGGELAIGAPGVQLGGAGAAPLLPFTDDFNRADGALGNDWTGSTWTISGNKAVNTPTLGSELIANGGFDADTNWTKGTNWTIAAGVANHAVGATSSLTQAIATIGVWYRLIWTVAAYSGSSGVQSQFGTTANLTSAVAAALGTYTHSGRANGATLGMRANTNAVVDLDNASAKALTLSTLFAVREYGRADVDASIKATIVSGNRAGLVLNLDSTSSPANFVIASHDGTNARLTKCVGGTYTDLISAAATYSAGAVLRVVKSGTSYALWYNGVQIGTDQSVSDVNIISNTNHGLFNTYELNSLDVFAIEAE